MMTGGGRGKMERSLWRAGLPRAAVFLVYCVSAGVGGARAQEKLGQATPVQREVKQVQGNGVPLDRLVAVVNEDVILESDLDEELRLSSAFQPFRDTSRNSTRQQLVERLINRTLILQQARLQLDDEITNEQVTEELTARRKDILACKEYHCETDAGWQWFVKDQGFTMDELTKLWHDRMVVLRFIEERFRSGIDIGQDQIKDYYDKTLVPQYSKEHATVPKLETIADRIREILLQQQVNSLLADWLKSLRAQGTVRMIQPDEVTP